MINWYEFSEKSLSKPIKNLTHRSMILMKSLNDHIWPKNSLNLMFFFSFLLSQSRQSVTSLYRFCIKKSNMVLSLWYSNHRLFKRWMPSQTGSKFSSSLTMKPQCKSYRIPNSHESEVWFKRRSISPRSANPDDNCLPPLPPD